MGPMSLRRHSPEMIAKIVKLSPHRTVAEVAAALGITKGVVSGLRYRHGMTSPERSPIKHGFHPNTATGLLR